MVLANRYFKGVGSSQNSVSLFALQPEITGLFLFSSVFFDLCPATALLHFYFYFYSTFFPTKDIFNFNNDLARKFQLLPNIHFVDHNNLQDDDTSSILTDKKHLNDAGIKLFSKNLKDCIFGRIQRKVRAKRVMSPPRMSKYEFPANKESMRSKRPYKKSGNKHSRYDRDSDD